jgi:hypothetical protein
MTFWTVVYLIAFICVTPFLFAAIILSIYTLTDEVDAPVEEDNWDSLDW